MSWFRDFQAIWPFPEDYVCIDVETSGLSPVNNMLCTFGYTRVRARQAITTHMIVLNWFDHPDVNTEQLSQELVNCANAMRAKGDQFFHTEEYIRTRGMNPIQGLQVIREVIRQAEGENTPLVAHNGYMFDAEFLQAHFHDFLGESVLIGDNAMFDTGMAEKASQLPDTDNPLPQEGETMRKWAWRVGGLRRRGVYWSARVHCEQRYNISTRYNLDMSRYHTSDFDTQFLHHLFEEQRLQAAA